MEDYLNTKFELMKALLPYMRQSAKTIKKTIESWVNPLSNKYRISQYYGNISDLYKGVTQGSKHLGLDIATPMGTAIKAPVSGNIQTGYDPKGWGQYVRITDPNGLVYQFSHLKNYNPNIQGQVQAGQDIGYTGGVGPMSGRSTGAHLDISVKKDNKYIDPLTIEQLRRAVI